LLLSKRNEKWLVQNHAIEFGKAHYPFIITLHVLFFVSIIIEYIARSAPHYSLFFIVLSFLLLLLKVWIVVSLGKFWTTKIYRIPGVPLVKKGPYKYLKHPNYLVVIAEIVIIPLAFHLYYTAFVFTLLNILLLYVRVKEENKALQI
jgi:methyltransferase